MEPVGKRVMKGVDQVRIVRLANFCNRFADAPRKCHLDVRRDIALKIERGRWRWHGYGGRSRRGGRNGKRRMLANGIGNDFAGRACLDFPFLFQDPSFEILDFFLRILELLGLFHTLTIARRLGCLYNYGMEKLSPKQKRVTILLVGIILIAAFFRIWQLDYDPSRAPFPPMIPPGLFSDEAMNGNNAHEALRTFSDPEGEGFEIFYPENNGREGLFINLQALSVALLGHTAFALRIVSALFGILTVLALYYFMREYTENQNAALLSAFFLATGFWHVMFSRIGFRAIMAPFFLTAALAALYAAWNRRSHKNHSHPILISVLGGVLFGLGFYSYIAYRAAPLLVLPAFYLFFKAARRERSGCTLCIPAVFILGAVVVTVPLLLYFGMHPQDFFGRTSQISIFSQENPLGAFALNLGKTIQMFYFVGDLNWRHNFSGYPLLWWPVAAFFTVGFFEALRKKYFLLPLWFFVMLLPVAISSEGIPHALRAIIVIPPVFAFAGLGFDLLWSVWASWLKKSEEKYDDAASTIKRIRKTTPILAIVILAATAIYSFNEYFQRWAISPYTRKAFESELYQIGLFLKNADPAIPKYVLTNSVDSIDRTGRPMALQPILFVTETYLPEPEGARNIHYLTKKEFDQISCAPDCLIVILDELQPTMKTLKERIPNLELSQEIERSHGLLVARPKR